MKEYSFSYRFDNKDWTVGIYANTEDEAKRKFWALKENGKYDGEIVCRVNATKPYNFSALLLVTSLRYRPQTTVSEIRASLSLYREVCKPSHLSMRS